MRSSGSASQALSASNLAAVAGNSPQNVAECAEGGDQSSPAQNSADNKDQTCSTPCNNSRWGESNYSGGNRVHCEEQLDEEEDAPYAAHISGSGEKDEDSCPSLPVNGLGSHFDADPLGQADGEVGFCSPCPHSDRSDSYGNPCGVYEEEVFANMKIKEMSRKAIWGYLENKQSNLTAKHRHTMINWLVEFADEFRLQCETLFLGVAIFDQFLCDGPMVETNALQLLGTTCMLLAVKFQESQLPPMIRCCCEAAEGTFTHGQVILMEIEVLKTIGFNCTLPTSHSFLGYFLRSINASLELSKLAEYLLFLSLMDYDCLQCSPSAISAGAVILAEHTLRTERFSHVQILSKCAMKDIQQAVMMLHRLHSEFQCATHSKWAAKNKFLLPENLGIARLKARELVPGDIFPVEILH